MRRLFLILGLVALAGAAEAQETYSLPATAGQVTNLNIIALGQNERVCKRLALASTCTQAQACTAATAPGGASCTAAQARGADVRIYPSTLAGREEFVTFKFLAPDFIAALQAVGSQHQSTFCAWFIAQSQGGQDTVCTNAGLPAGCRICK